MIAIKNRGKSTQRTQFSGKITDYKTYVTFENQTPIKKKTPDIFILEDVGTKL